jgi:cobaltochelatase CobS
MNETIKTIKAGDVISTKHGDATVLSIGTKAGRGGKKTFASYTLRFENTGSTLTVTRRGLGKMSAFLPTRSEPTPVVARGESQQVTPSIGEWRQRLDRIKSVQPTTVEPEEEEVEDVAEPVAEAPVQNGLAAMLADLIKPYINAKVSRDEVERMVDERVAATAVRRVEVVSVDGETQNLGVQHVRFDGLLRLAACRLHTYLVGPAGSGKTTVVENVAKALKLPFYSKSVGQQTSEVGLMGYMDAQGRYVRSPLREAYENGGVFLLDEIDSGNASVLVVLNALLANDRCSFPDGMIEKHKDLVVFAGANTIGQGGDRQYVGKCQLDATTLDRFVFCDFQYDSGIEAARCGVPADCFGPRPEAFTLFDPGHSAAQQMCESYCRKLYAVRKAIESFNGAVRHVVSPRASFSGTTMIRAGFTAKDAEEMCIWKGVDPSTRAKIEAAATR